jgi:hypothetical protein
MFSIGLAILNGMIQYDAKPRFAPTLAGTSSNPCWFSDDLPFGNLT